MQVITLTDISGDQFDLFVNQIKMIDEFTNGDTHIIFDGDMGRTVKEKKEQIYAALGITPLKVTL